MIDLRRFREGNRAYLEELVRTHGDLVLEVAEGFAADPDHLQDLFQDIWTQVFRKRGTFRGQGSFESWLHRISTRVCISDYRYRMAGSRALFRKREQERTNGHQGRSDDPMTEYEVKQTHARLHRAMAELTRREHEAICLRILDRKPPDEVARIMGIKKSTVRSLLRHGINRLRKLMEGFSDELPGYS